MAEFCYKCFCDLWDIDAKEKELLMSDHEELCEGCAEHKKVVLGYKKDFYVYRIKTALPIIAAVLVMTIIVFAFIKSRTS